MVRIEKMYFTLKEVAKRWGVRKCDIAYMVENGMLQTSVQLVDVHLERGLLEVDRNQEFHMPNEQAWYTGLLDLMVRDAVVALRSGTAQVVHFAAPQDEYAMLIQPTGPAEISAKHLVLRRCERDRVEAHYGEAGNTVAEGIAFQHSDGYRSVRLGDLRFALSGAPLQRSRGLQLPPPRPHPPNRRAPPRPQPALPPLPGSVRPDPETRTNRPGGIARANPIPTKKLA